MTTKTKTNIVFLFEQKCIVLIAVILFYNGKINTVIDGLKRRYNIQCSRTVYCIEVISISQKKTQDSTGYVLWVPRSTNTPLQIIMSDKKKNTFLIKR